MKNIDKKYLKNLINSNKVNYLDNDLRNDKTKEVKYDETVVQYLLENIENESNEIKKQYFKNEIVKQSYSIIFSLIKKMNFKFKLNYSFFTNEDLFNEGVLIVFRCIEKYKKNFKVKFITFLWVSLYRGFLRELENNVLKPNKIFNDFEINDNNDDDQNDDDFYFNKKVKNGEREYFHEENEETFYIENLNEFEVNFLHLRYKKYNVKEICEMLEISNSEFYQMLNKIKTKISKKQKE